MQYTNQFKTSVFPSLAALQAARLSFTLQQFANFLDSLTLKQAEQLLTLHDPFLISYISHFLNEYQKSSPRKSNDLYKAIKDDKIIMYIYDCKMFRSNTYEKDDNDLISSFSVFYQETQAEEDDVINQLLNPNVIGKGSWALKVKASAILKVMAMIRTLRITEVGNIDAIALQSNLYASFIDQWVKYHFSFKQETYLLHFFKGVLYLLENQLILAYFQTLTPQDIYTRLYKRPIKSIDKPRTAEQFTQVEPRFGQIKWQSLKVTVFKIKYRVQEGQTSYTCYRLEEKNEHTKQRNQQQYTAEDRAIISCFNKVRAVQQESKYSYSY